MPEGKGRLTCIFLVLASATFWELFLWLDSSSVRPTLMPSCCTAVAAGSQHAWEYPGVRLRLSSSPHVECSPIRDQAIRMYVNQELEAIDQLISHAEVLLRPGGRLAILSYHSLEDRLIKRRLFQHPGQPPMAALLARTHSPSSSASMRSRRRRYKFQGGNRDCKKASACKTEVEKAWRWGTDAALPGNLRSGVGAEFPLSSRLGDDSLLPFLGEQIELEEGSRNQHRLWKSVSKVRRATTPRFVMQQKKRETNALSRPLPAGAVTCPWCATGLLLRPGRRPWGYPQASELYR